MPDLDSIATGQGPQAGDPDVVVLDFSAAKDFKPLDPGVYPAVVTAVETGKKSKAGNDKLVFVFQATKPNGKTHQLYRHCVVNGEGSGITRDTIEALGFEAEGETLPFRPSDAVGLKVELEVAYQEDDPKFNEITKITLVP